MLLFVFVVVIVIVGIAGVLLFALLVCCCLHCCRVVACIVSVFSLWPPTSYSTPLAVPAPPGYTLARGLGVTVREDTSSLGGAALGTTHHGVLWRYSEGGIESVGLMIYAGGHTPWSRLGI